MKMTKLLATLGVMSMLATSAWAQGPGGGMQGGSGMRMRNSPKFRLTSLVRGIGALEHNPKAALTPAQARLVVGAIKPWRNKPKMDDNQAKALFMKLDGVLTLRQKNELDKLAATNRRFRGGQGGAMGGGGRMGNGGRGGMGGSMPSAAEMQKNRKNRQAISSFMITMNPFYPPSAYKQMKDASPRMREGLQRRYDRTRQLLAALTVKAAKKK